MDSAEHITHGFDDVEVDPDRLAARCQAIDRTLEKMREAKAAGFQELEFDMTNWFARNGSYDCGTAACLAGWVVHANSNFEIPDLIDIGHGKDGTIPERARHLLHLSKADASILFFAKDNNWEDLAFDRITIDHAIEALEYLKETGRASWSELDHAADYSEDR